MKKFILGHKIIIGLLAGIAIASGAGYAVYSNFSVGKHESKKVTKEKQSDQNDNKTSNKKEVISKKDSSKSQNLLDDVEMTFFGPNGEGGAYFDVDALYARIDTILGEAVDFPLEEVTRIRNHQYSFSTYASEGYKTKLAKVLPWVEATYIMSPVQSNSLRNGDPVTLKIDTADDPTNPIKPETRTWIVSGLE